jgi:MHS family proline/betaine transporter-like MFS transporter
MMPAYYLVATSAIGAVAVYFIHETAGRPLLGSMPSVDTVAEAHELVAGQDTNENLNLHEMPFDHTYEPADPAKTRGGAASGKGRSAK